MYLSLNQIKHHLIVDENFRDDDPYIIQLYKVAEEVVSKHIDTDLSELVDDSGDLPAGITHAILLLIGNFYANRDSVTNLNINKIPFSYDYLLSLYQNYYPSKFKS